jgi:glycosyltransferase involved in cell wall biosynthesis
LKLLYITNSINGSGGLERVLSIKASYFADVLGYNVHIIVLNNGHLNLFYNFSSKLKYHNVNVGRNLFSYFLTYKNGIKNIINEIKPNVILVCDDGLKGFFLPRLIKTDAKWIYERHASIELNTSNSLKGNIVKKLMHSQVTRFDKFVVLTNSNIKEWKGKNVVAIPNPLSFEIDKKALLINKRVIAVGSHSYNKGYDTLLKIWKELEMKHPDWTLNIYGKIDKDETFIKLRDALGLRNVNFHNPVNNIKEKYLESSIMVLPSRSEGFGMVLIEAMSCGVPCVAFDCPSGPGDIINNEIDGLLVENQNLKKFEHSLDKLFLNGKLRIEMGDCAIENAKRYKIDYISVLWEQLFKSILNENSI